MKILTRAENDMRAITDFMNRNGIKKEDIISLFQSKDGTYFLTYCGEE